MQMATISLPAVLVDAESGGNTEVTAVVKVDDAADVVSLINGTSSSASSLVAENAAAPAKILPMADFAASISGKISDNVDAYQSTAVTELLQSLVKGDRGQLSAVIPAANNDFHQS